MAYALLLQKKLHSCSARHLHNGSNTDSQHFTRCFARCFQKHRVLHVRKCAPFCWPVLAGEHRGSPCDRHCGTAQPGTAHSPRLQGAPCCEKHEMLPAVATSSRSQGPSEPAGAAAWQKPPSTGTEQLLNTFPLCDFHQFNRSTA